MPRTCTDATRRQIKALDDFPMGKGRWLNAALSDCYHGKPMSIERERRMCEALGIDAPQRKPYWRPCLPATLTTEQRAQVVALAQALEGD